MADGRIQRLNLSAKSDSLIRRGVFLVEDAMRTASVPDTGRLLIYRAISLGTIRSDLPPTSLALQLERRFRELASQAVHALEPSAQDAPCVFFWDDAEPYSALTLILCRGGRAEAWFWPLIVPGFRADMPLFEALRSAAQGAMSSAAGPGAFIRMVQELSQAGGLDVFLSALWPEDASILLRALGSEPSQWFENIQQSAAESISGPGVPPSPLQVALQSPTNLRTLQKWVETWGIQDIRSPFLAAVLLCMERPSRLFDRRLPSQVHALLRALEPPRLDQAPKPVEPAELGHLSFGPSSPPPVSHPMISPIATPTPETEPSLLSIEPKPSVGANSLPASSVERAAIPPEPRTSQTRMIFSPPSNSASSLTPQAQSSNSPPSVVYPVNPPPEISPSIQLQSKPALSLSEQTFHSATSRAAGLFFLVPIFERFGMSTLLQSHPSLLDAEFAPHLFMHIAQRLGIDMDDPLLQIFRPKTSQSILIMEYLAGPWSDLLSIPQPETSISFPQLIRIFHHSARRYCRRRVGMGLIRLVCRYGRIQITKTHADIFFEHGQADILIRKAGLDIDPGWVPWLGRVIHYHYE